MRALISHSDPNGQIFGRVFGETHFHHCGFNVSVAICLCRLIYSAETELSGELMQPSNDSWKRIGTSSVPVPLAADGFGSAYCSLSPPGLTGTAPGTGAPGGQVPQHPACTFLPVHPPSLPPRHRLCASPPQVCAESVVPASGGRRSSPHSADRNIFHLQPHQNTNPSHKTNEKYSFFVFKHDIHGGFAVCMLQRALFLAPCLLKLGPLFSTVYQDQYV